MKKISRHFSLVAGLFVTAIFFSAFVRYNAADKIAMPYQKAGLSDEQAAAHLLNRFTFGAQPGQVAEVVAMGLNKWMQLQLDAKQNDDSLNLLLSKYDDINLSNTAVENKFPRSPIVKRMAIKDGFLNKDSVSTQNKQYEREAIRKYMESKGFHPSQELFREFFNQKILRSAYSNNQLQEVLTDFWFNHFNVAIVKPACANYIPAYERDIIRPNVLGNFETLLVKTAQSPAMLVYLDNYISSGANVEPEKDMQTQKMTANKRKNKPSAPASKPKKQADNKQKKSGLNENYAREVMELHTLGVDGGYTQSDVTQAARVLTGWTVAPLGDYGMGSGYKALIDRAGMDKLTERGFYLDGDFFFAANRHDNGEKVVLGHKFPAGGGYQEGLTLLDILAHHPATAKFISKKLAVRFVSDNPPQSLIDKMAKTFMRTKGNIKEVLITLVNSPEFWAPAGLRDKTKSPFELAISAVRGLNADVSQPFQLYNWVNKMGQQLYYYQAPTGFPDNGKYWINTGSLLNRMNFGLAIASQRIPGVRIDLAALNQHKEPESAEAALKTYCHILLPERDITSTVARLKPILTSPNLQATVSSAAEKNKLSKPLDTDELQMSPKTKADNNPKTKNGNNNMLAQVVGIIIGSPEFQRR
jgi:uncharacterized protein (DUF1800 family)